MKQTLCMIAFVVAAAARAHPSLEQPEAAAGSTYKAVLRISHGCHGTPTHTVSVRLPAGLRGARPMPKPGWVLTLRKEPLAEPYDSHGRRVTEDVVEVRWAARTREAWLDNASFDEFTLLAQLPATPGTLWFKVRQECEQGAWDWSEIPADGTDTHALKSPAVALRVGPPPAAAHVH